MSSITRFTLFMICLHLGHQQEPSSNREPSTQQIPSQELIDSIFRERPKPPANISEAIFTTRPTPIVTPKNPENPCYCVPHYQCSDNFTIIRDGAGLINIRTDDQSEPTQPNQCPHYMLLCCRLESMRNDSIIPDLLPRKGCGFRNEDGVGFRTDQVGDISKFGEFPWMVAVLVEEQIGSDQILKYKSGGALIHPKVVLTAAHYVGTKRKFWARAGEWDPKTNLEVLPHQDVAVNEVIVHPKFYSGGLHNDVALLILEKEIQFDNHIDVLCLPPQDYVVPDNTMCLASGWGNDKFGEEGAYQVILKKVELPFMERNTCEQRFRKTRLGAHYILDKSLVCAGGKEGVDTCVGDGGSPLICPIPGTTDRYLQAGIVAFGVGCGTPGIPGAYTNVAFFRNWIDEQMALKNLDPSTYQYQIKDAKKLDN